jgi:tetratricopeptide (TPR) repeat protein
MHKMVNELEEATHYYTLALHKYKKIVGTSHRSYAATLNNLGLVFLSQAQQAESKGSGNKLQSMGYLESAEVTLREVLRIRGDILEEDDPAVLITRSNLASVLQRTGRGEEGEELLRTTLARVIEKKGRESPEVAMALNNLGYLLKAEGRWEEAAGFYEEALALRRSLFPADHPQIIISLNNLAELYLSQEPPQEDKAKALQEEILGILQGREGGGGGE